MGGGWFRLLLGGRACHGGVGVLLGTLDWMDTASLGLDLSALTRIILITDTQHRQRETHDNMRHKTSRLF